MKFNEETKVMLWEAANKLRGNVAQFDYKDIVLGIVFLRYADVSFNLRLKEIMDEDDRFIDDREEYEKKGVFYLPKESRFNYLLECDNGKLNKSLDNALEMMMKENAGLKGVLNKCYTRLDVDPTKLKDVMRLIAGVESSDGTNDYYGEIYMYFVGKFAMNDGSGEYFTPSSIVNTLVNLIKPYKGKLYDPACGSGGMFIHSLDKIKLLHQNPNDLLVYGQELNTATWRLAKMNLAINKITNDKLGNGGSDAFLDDIHPTLKADFILANPPFNIKDWGQEKLLDDKRWSYGIPPKGNANYAWLSHILYHLKDDGKAGIVLANGSLSTNQSQEYEIRKNFIDENVVDCIINLPDKLFKTSGTAISCCLWILNKKKKTSDILFIDAKNIEGNMIGRALRELKDTDIDSIVNKYEEFELGNINAVDELGFSKVVSLEKVIENNYVLTPGRYVGIAKGVDDGISYEEKMQQLTNELNFLFSQNKELEKKVTMSIEGLNE